MLLEQIISSSARLKILKFFCINSEGKFFVREIARTLKIQLNSARRELSNLDKLGFLQSEVKTGKKYYFADENFALYQEIKNLIFKASALEEIVMANKMAKIPGLKLLIYTGNLTKSPAATDVLAVGRVKKSDLDKYLKKIADGRSEALRYTVLPEKEYLYRMEISDKFVYEIWANPHLVLLDKVDKSKPRHTEDTGLKHFKGEEEEKKLEK